MSVLRLRQRQRFYRSRTLREIAAIGRLLRAPKGHPDLAHLAFYEEWASGPIQRDEALLLHALVRDLRPETVVEIGFLYGDSAFNFLLALDENARLYSFDIDPACDNYARARCGHDPRFVFRNRSQDQLTREDIDGRLADFVFLDASHDLVRNQATFERLLTFMAPRATVVVHDTGSTPKAITPAGHFTLDLTERWVGDEYECSPDERAFVNWLREVHPEFAQIHLHATRAYRHGMTLLQRSRPLVRP